MSRAVHCTPSFFRVQMFRCRGARHLIAGLLGLLAASQGAAFAWSLGAFQDADTERMFEVRGEVAVWMDAGEPALAIEVLLDLVEDFEGSFEFRVWALVGLGELERKLGREIEAKEHLLEARAELAHLERHPYVCSVEGSLGNIYLDWGLHALADDCFQRELAVARQLNTVMREFDGARVNANWHQVLFALATRSLEEVEERVSRAFENEALYARLPEQRGKLLVCLAAAYGEEARRDIGHAEPAIDTALEALELDGLAPPEALRAHLILAEVQLLRGELETAAQALDRAREHAEVLDLDWHNGNQRRWAVLSARLARQRGADEATLRGWEAKLREAYATFIDSWNLLDPRPSGYGPLHYQGAAALPGELIRLALALESGDEGVRSAFDYFLRAQELGALARSSRGAPTSLAGIQEHLLKGSERAGVLAYLPGPQGTHLFMLDGQGIQHTELAGRDGIESVLFPVVRRLMRSPGELSPASLAIRDKALQKLAETLLPSEALLRLSGWDRLTIVGSDLIGGAVPFEALPVGAGELLGTIIAVDSLPSLPYGHARVTEAREVSGPIEELGGSAWLLADPFLPSASGAAPAAGSPIDCGPPLTGAMRAGLAALQPLAVGRGELEEMFEVYPDSERRFLFGGAAAEAALFEPELESAAVLQLFTHGIADLSRECYAGIVLAAGGGEDGLLWPEEAILGKSATCVVLTACRAGRGPDRKGDAGAADLSGAFLRAGARSVIISDYDLDIEATRRLSIVFHRSLRAGDTPAQALRVARIELRADERFHDPYYSGLLRVVGLGHEPVFERAAGGDDSFWAFTLFGGVILVGAACALRLRSPARATTTAK